MKIPSGTADGWDGYRELKDEYTHFASVQGAGKNAVEDLPLIHTLFSNLKAWLVGTHHGVSAKHLPRYLREWNYRFNRRWGAARILFAIASSSRSRACRA